jgi:hypothetical protein
MSEIRAETNFKKEQTTDINYTYDKEKRGLRLIPVDITCFI